MLGEGAVLVGERAIVIFTEVTLSAGSSSNGVQQVIWRDFTFFLIKVDLSFGLSAPTLEPDSDRSDAFGCYRSYWVLDVT